MGDTASPSLLGPKHLIRQYKAILASIVPPEMLTDDGLLKKHDGTGEPLTIIGPDGSVLGFIASLLWKAVGIAEPGAGGFAYYKGALPYKAFRHRLEKNKENLQVDEYRVLAKVAQDNILCEGDRDVISTSGGVHKGVLAHETFHDIQGFLYDYYPDAIDALHSAVLSNRQRISDFYTHPSNSDVVSHSYTLANFFPSTIANAPGNPLRILGDVGPATLSDVAGEAYGAALRRKEIKTPSGVMTAEASRLIAESQMDIGRNEVIPVLLSAASEGNSEAADILADVFAAAGLNREFAGSLPRLADEEVFADEDSFAEQRLRSRLKKVALGGVLCLYLAALIYGLLCRK